MWFIKKYCPLNPVLCSIIILFLLLCSCNKDTSPLDAPEIALSVVNVGVTEAWLQLELRSPLCRL
jgi:hypothetical protein